MQTTYRKHGRWKCDCGRRISLATPICFRCMALRKYIVGKKRAYRDMPAPSIHQKILKKLPSSCSFKGCHWEESGGRDHGTFVGDKYYCTAHANEVYKLRKKHD